MSASHRIVASKEPLKQLFASSKEKSNRWGALDYYYFLVFSLEIIFSSFLFS